MVAVCQKCFHEGDNKYHVCWEVNVLKRSDAATATTNPPHTCTTDRLFAGDGLCKCMCPRCWDEAIDRCICPNGCICPDHDMTRERR